MRTASRTVRCQSFSDAISPVPHAYLIPRTSRKEVDFGNGKVLLSKIGDKIHATSAYCTHYGAPLVKGVLVADGRVVWCDLIPLPDYTLKLTPGTAHGTEVLSLHRTPNPAHSQQPSSACFNVCTGDIEDAPAPAAIHSFKTTISDGKILVTADEERVAKANMSRTPKVAANVDAGLSSGAAGVVIVGGGSGTFHAILSLREVRRRRLRCRSCWSLGLNWCLQHGYAGPITVVSKEPHSPIDRSIQVSYALRSST